MKITILDAITLGEDIVLDAISSLGDTTIYKTSSPEEIPSRINNTNVIVTNKCKLNEQTLRGAKDLQLICVAATGYDNIDTEYCKKNNIAVCNVKGYSTDNVAQITISMVLYLVNHLSEYTNYVTSGKYSNSGFANCLSPAYHEISSLTWGVVGLGNIGKKVAHIAKALGCNVIANRRSMKDDEFTCVSLDELVEKSDIITLHTPLTNETRHIINDEKISKMKKGVIIVNVARGAVCDEEAITNNVINGKIGGFGCDVYSTEPLSQNHPFNKILNYNNTIFTPHMAWGSIEARNRCVDEMSKNIVAFYNNEIRSRIV